MARQALRTRPTQLLIMASKGLGSAPTCQTRRVSNRRFPRQASGQTRRCAEPGSCSGPNAGAGGNLHCAAKLLPLYSTCNHTMTQLLDAMDGATDGVAQIVENMRGTCLTVPSTSIIDEMIRMRDEDGCTINGNGVGEQAVVTQSDGCSDTDATLCGLVDSGILSCEDDFCPDCTNAHKCDATCTFDCNANGAETGKEHRRVQIHLDTGCSALNLEEKVEPVNDACWYATLHMLLCLYAFVRPNLACMHRQPGRFPVPVCCNPACATTNNTARYDFACLQRSYEKPRAKVVAVEFRRSVMCNVRCALPF